MAKRIAVTNLNATTVEILNTIRANASAEYQSLVPVVNRETDIPKVGEILYGYPAIANQFISSLVTRIALVRVRSATFNNAYAKFKKGYLEFGETVEEVFVGLTKAREFSAEKAEQRELKRTLPDVRTAFHAMNWRVLYPITIQDEDLRTAFLSISGVQDLIAKIVDAVYTSAEYDEYLLFKYLLIKAISHGKMYPVSIGNGDMKTAARKFRGMSNQLTFMSNKYNSAGVHTTTPKSDQFIFMDSQYNADYDVEVLASAFNMDKANFMGSLVLIDSWTTFDSDRFSIITQNSDMLPEITSDELALMANVKAVLLDEEWFQVYDNQNKMTEKYVASGEYWNYFYHTWKTVSSSPFSNAIVFVTDANAVALPATLTFTISDKVVSDESTIFTLELDESTATLANHNFNFVQVEDAVEAGVAIHKYGAVIMPESAVTDKASFALEVQIEDTVYTATTEISAESEVGDSFTFTTE